MTAYLDTAIYYLTLITYYLIIASYYIDVATYYLVTVIRYSHYIALIISLLHCCRHLSTYMYISIYQTLFPLYWMVLMWWIYCNGDNRNINYFLSIINDKYSCTERIFEYLSVISLLSHYRNLII